ncbi:hypothetical protein DFH94DRAFT_682687 [Russula ochroleuca]|uniref:Uncharacterized protein n=1 Tax=Russula ochroleuca TaxID=152965 RepID=A0A9P5T7Z1_9AGAM|nr:hypothetical protein DFH94DRAFT_682687 [Russula ochroleuca]
MGVGIESRSIELSQKPSAKRVWAVDKGRATVWWWAWAWVKHRHMHQTCAGASRARSSKGGHNSMGTGKHESVRKASEWMAGNHILYPLSPSPLRSVLMTCWAKACIVLVWHIGELQLCDDRLKQMASRTGNQTYGPVPPISQTPNWTISLVQQTFGSNHGSEPNFDTTRAHSIILYWMYVLIEWAYV